MRRLILLFGLGVLIATAFLVVPAFGANGTTTCNGTLGAGTYNRVVVPRDGVCLSDGPVTIRAGLFVQQGGTIVFGSEENPVHTATINGGVHATNAMNVQIHFSTINGGIDISGFKACRLGASREEVAEDEDRVADRPRRLPSSDAPHLRESERMQERQLLRIA